MARSIARSLLLPLCLLSTLAGCSNPPPASDDATIPEDAAAPDASADGTLPGPDLRLPGTDGPTADLAAPGPPPVDRLKNLSLVILLGDSVAAGYNASGRNGIGGHGFGRLLMNNHPDFPRYAGHDLATRFPGVLFKDLSQSGATSDEMLADLKSKLSGGGLPATVPGDVLVFINIGGNDFKNGDALINEVKARALAAKIRSNLAQTYGLLRTRYAVAGKNIVFLEDNVHEPTDGMGTIPPGFTDGLCKLLIGLSLFKMQIIKNFALMNGELAAEVTAQGGYLVDIQAGFLGHGMHSGAARWIDTDCVHPINPGHDLIRRLNWQVLTGETY